jgi:hypothetical protein
MPGLERPQHLQRALEQTEFVLRGHVMLAIAQAKFRVAFRRQAGDGMLQRIVQTQADDIGCLGITGGRHANVAASLLDAAHDQRRRVKQGAVPIEGDQVEAARTQSHGRAGGRWVNKDRHSAGKGAVSSTRSPLAG